MESEVITPDESAYPGEPSGYRATSRRGIRIVLWTVVGMIILTGLFSLILMVRMKSTRTTVGRQLESSASGKTKNPSNDAASASKRNESVKKSLAGLAPGPKELFIIIDTAANRLTLRQGDKVLREAIASCGSGNVLEDPATGKKWVFDTPRGIFEIKSKVVDPDWVKPDWAFIEEGKPLPKNYKDRVEPGVMGDYALGFGDGYFLHGTLYKRLLGRNVSHGCVRLGDEDLKYVFDSVKTGTKVLIF